MRKVTLGWIIVTLVLVSLVFPACSSSPSPSSSTPTFAPAPAQPASPSTVPLPSKPNAPASSSPTPSSSSTITRGGDLKILYTGGVTDIGHPGYMNTPADIRYVLPAVQNLIIPDEKGNYLPCLASSWDIAPDGKSITFHLRQGVKYHDGTDFNAQSVKATLEIIKGGQLTNYKDVTSFEVVDPYTIKLNIPKFDWQLVSSIATHESGWMISPTSLQSHEKEWSMTHPVGTGPFKFASFSQDVSLKYTRFENYWDQGKPYLDSVEFLIVSDPSTALAAFKSGAAQANCSVTPKDVADLKKSGFDIITSPGSVASRAPSNANANSPFANLKVRQAVQYAIDTKTIAETLGYGYYEPANQPFGPWTWANNPAIVGYPYNPSKAKQLLAEAGFPNGFNTKIIMVSSNPQTMPIAVQAYLKVIGINAEIEPITLPMFSQRNTTNWEGLLSITQAYVTGMDPGQSLISGFLGPSAQISVKREADITAKLYAANAETDPAKRKALFDVMMKQIVDEQCMIDFIYASRSLAVQTPKLHDSGIGLNSKWPLGNAWLSK